MRPVHLNQPYSCVYCQSTPGYYIVMGVGVNGNRLVPCKASIGADGIHQWVCGCVPPWNAPHGARKILDTSPWRRVTFYDLARSDYFGIQRHQIKPRRESWLNLIYWRRGFGWSGAQNKAYATRLRELNANYNKLYDEHQKCLQKTRHAGGVREHRGSRR